MEKTFFENSGANSDSSNARFPRHAFGIILAAASPWRIANMFKILAVALPLAWLGQSQFVAGQEPGETNSAADDTFLSIVFSGGWIGILIMICLILLSLLAVYLMVEQAMFLRRKNIAPEDLGEGVKQLLAQGKVKDADAFCRSKPCPLAFVLVSGISEIEFGWPAVEKALEETLAEQAARLYRKVEYLSVIGNIAPMLGLLGTVTGMIVAFRQVAISEGTAGAGDLAQGIYSALVTTVAGLMIAIPGLAAFAVFRNRIDELIAETAYSAQHAFAPIRRRIPGATIRPSSPVVPPRSPG
jgi:biopolymer transport protein ExbB